MGKKPVIFWAGLITACMALVGCNCCGDKCNSNKGCCKNGSCSGGTCSTTTPTGTTPVANNSNAYIAPGTPGVPGGAAPTSYGNPRNTTFNTQNTPNYGVPVYPANNNVPAATSSTSNLVAPTRPAPGHIPFGFLHFDTCPRARRADLQVHPSG